MNEEELFCKLFPEYVVNGKPLSPYFDLFESGYEQAEKYKVVEHFEAYGQCRDSRRIAELEAQIEKMKRCEICKHYQGESCNYHSNWVKDCKENGMKLFELKEIKENEID